MAAALPISGLTAWQGLFDHGRLTTGQTVLIHGAAGGVGSIAVQLAREVGARVIGTGRTADRDRALALGADTFVDLETEKLEAAGEVDVVFDVIGGDILDGSAALVRAGGTLVTIAEPPKTQPRDGRAIYFVVEADRARLADLAARVRDGRLHPVVGAVLPLAEAAAAFAPGKRIPGKTILRVAKTEAEPPVIRLRIAGTWPRLRLNLSIPTETGGAEPRHAANPVHQSGTSLRGSASDIVGDRTTGCGMDRSRGFVIGIGVRRRRNGVRGDAGDPVLIDLEIAPLVCAAAPWGHRLGIDDRRLDPRVDTGARAHYRRHGVLAVHDDCGVARDNDWGDYTARAAHPRRGRFDLTKYTLDANGWMPLVRVDILHLPGAAK